MVTIGSDDDTPGQEGAERDLAAGRRDDAAGARDLAAVTRDDAGAKRDGVNRQRDWSGDRRDQAGDRRDRAADRRDAASQARDQDGARRDVAGARRDQVALQRDHAAEQRDSTETGEGEPGTVADALIRSALARRDAASDRRRASQDRRAGASGRVEAERDRDAGASERLAAEHDRDAAASERTEAESERDTANADRRMGAEERVAAELDRTTAATDREASAKDRSNAFDELTGAYRRAAGLVELEREIARAKRTGEPLALVSMDVEALETVNETRGRGAGDRMLVEVADAITANFRPYDLVIRTGGNRFVCAVAGLDAAHTTERLSHFRTALNDAPEHASVATGVAELLPGDSRDDVLERAGVALRERQQPSA